MRTDWSVRFDCVVYGLPLVVCQQLDSNYAALGGDEQLVGKRRELVEAEERVEPTLRDRLGAMESPGECAGDCPLCVGVAAEVDGRDDCFFEAGVSQERPDG